MIEIRNFFTNLLFARQAAISAEPSPFARKGESAGEPVAAERTVRDTVTLSEGGHKIVNLARGQELAEKIQAAPVDKDFLDNLLKAQEDIIRINLLFAETIKALFLEQRR